MSGKHRAETARPDPAVAGVLLFIFLAGVFIGRRGRGD